MAFISLDKVSRVEVLQHLRRMAEEEDWHPEQRVSAESALEALKDFH